MDQYLVPNNKRPRTDDTDHAQAITDISKSPEEGPHQPVLQKYPMRKCGSQHRPFNRSWYESHSWLEYSETKDAAYCFVCRHFRQNVGRTETAFTKDGFTNWKNATQTFKTHETSMGHKYAMQDWVESKNRVKQGSTIKTMLDEGHLKTVRENRRYLAAVIDSLRFTACQEIAQRGHRENPSSTNRGNFLELLSLFGKYDEIVKQKIQDLPARAKYTHHDIQNEIIGIMANMIIREISEEVKASKYFALLVDETKDIRKTEQISVVVRYLYDNNIYE